VNISGQRGLIGESSPYEGNREDRGACRDDILDIVEDTVTFTHLVWILLQKVVCFEFEDCVLAQSQNCEMIVWIGEKDERLFLANDGRLRWMLY
jgi:hypothetical protein